MIGQEGTNGGGNRTSSFMYGSKRTGSGSVTTDLLINL
jgi:hypothetical protein